MECRKSSTVFTEKKISNKLNLNNLRRDMLTINTARVVQSLVKILTCILN